MSPCMTSHFTDMKEIKWILFQATESGEGYERVNILFMLFVLVLNQSLLVCTVAAGLVKLLTVIAIDYAQVKIA